MIYSELHNFLFLKGRKVASTSFEVALSKICGPNDVITPITPVDERQRIDLGYGHAQNFGADPDTLDSYINLLKTKDINQLKHASIPKGSIKNHTTFKEAWNFFGEHIKDKHVIGIIRNPYETIISRLNHIALFENYKQSGEAMKATDHQLQQALHNFIKKLNKKNYPKNIDIYEPPSNTSMPLKINYLKFEDLQNELDRFLHSLNISESITLPHLKKGQNLPPEAILNIASPEQLQIINSYFEDEFDAFGYQKL